MLVPLLNNLLYTLSVSFDWFTFLLDELSTLVLFYTNVIKE